MLRISILIGDQSYIKDVSDDSLNDGESSIIGLVRSSTWQPRSWNS